VKNPQTFNVAIILDLCICAVSRTNDHDGNNNNSVKTENITFRLRKDQLDQLRQEAKEKRINLNTLANQIVDSYVNYNSNLSSANVIPVSKAILVALVEACSEDQLKAIAERVQKKDTVDLALQLRGRCDFEAIVDIFEYWLRATGFRYRHNKESENNRYNFIIQHNMGRKYSFFAAECFKAYYESLATKKVEYSITDNSTAITVEG
jgi:DNA primase large subunit